MTALLNSARRASGMIRTHLGRSQEGITLAIFAVALLALLGMVAVGVDGGRLYDERRQVQNAADHAATTAANAYCNPSLASYQNAALAIAAGEASAGTNGYNGNDTNTVTIQNDPPGTSRFTVRIETTIPATFAKVVGWSDLDTQATATSQCTDAGGTVSGPGAVFGGGHNCTDVGKPSVKVNGSTSRVYGGMHSNAAFGISGSTNHFHEPGPPDDPVTHVGIFQNGGSDNNFQSPEYPKQVPMPDPQWPAGWAPGDATALASEYNALTTVAGMTVIKSTSKITSLNTNNAVYYTTHADGIDVGSVGAGVTNVVLVAPNGTIKLSTGSSTLRALEHPNLPRQGILMLAGITHPLGDRCDKFAIDVSGSGTTWEGILWAPGGLIKMAGSSNATVNGSLIAWAIELNGSNLTIRYNPDLYVDEGDPWVFIVD